MRTTIAMFVISVIILLASCVPETPEPPYGVWMSEEPKIILYLIPEYRVPIGVLNYFGIYMQDGIERKVLVTFGNGLRFGIYDLTEPRGIGAIGGVSHSGTLLVGTYRVVGEEIRYAITPQFQEQLGISTIIFHRTEDYDPIDPDWISNFVPRPD